MADVTGDGRADPLVLVDQTLTRLVSCGINCLNRAESLAVAGASSLAVGDVDGDGVADALVPGTAGVTVFFGNSSGLRLSNSTVVEYIGSEDDYTDIAVGDFNGDNVLDILTAGTVYAYRLGDGAGDFGDSTQLHEIQSSAAAVDYAIGDLDGNGDDEVVFAISAIPETFVVALLGSFSGQFLPTRSYGPLALGDLDGDGRDDLVAGNYDDTATVYRSTGSGFAPMTVDPDLALADRANDIELRDIDLDGTVDMISSNGAVVSWWNGAGDGTFLEGSGISRIDRNVPASPMDMAFGDVDDDGRDDLLVNYATAPYGDIALFLNISVNP